MDHRTLLDLPRFDTLPGELVIRPWDDLVIDSMGFDPRSSYVEQFWVGRLGPTPTWLLRRMAGHFDDNPDGFVLDLDLTARDLGVGPRTRRTSPFVRSLERLCRFGIAQPADGETLLVRRRVPPLTGMQLSRLPRHLQVAHRSWQDLDLRRGGPDQLVRHGERLVVSLLAVGLPTGEVEDQLRRWEFPEPVRQRILATALASPPPPAA